MGLRSQQKLQTLHEPFIMAYYGRQYDAKYFTRERPGLGQGSAAHVHARSSYDLCALCETLRPSDGSQILHSAC